MIAVVHIHMYLMKLYDEDNSLTDVLPVYVLDMNVKMSMVRCIDFFFLHELFNQKGGEQ